MNNIEGKELTNKLTHDDALKFYGHFDQDQLKARS